MPPPCGPLDPLRLAEGGRDTFLFNLACSDLCMFSASYLKGFRGLWEMRGFCMVGAGQCQEQRERERERDSERERGERERHIHIYIYRERERRRTKKSKENEQEIEREREKKKKWGRGGQAKRHREREGHKESTTPGKQVVKHTSKNELAERDRGKDKKSNMHPTLNV